MFGVPTVFGASILAVLLHLAWTASAAKGTVKALSDTQISWYKPFTYFASTAYCKPATTLAWDCGVNCQGNPDFIPTASGGDGALTQEWYVGYDPGHTTVIVAYQGTNLTEFFADFTDANFFLAPLDHDLFPGMKPPILAHSGFLAAHARTADVVLDAVKATLAARPADSVTVVGHSLGAALALLETISLQLHLPGVPVQHIGYGTPRVGNPDFVHWVDLHCPERITRIINHQDPVGIVPGQFLGYEHVAGEIYVTDAGWVKCAGNDNPSKQCATGDTTSVFDAEAENHNGPFDGVRMGCPTTS
ncbi:alpha/beta-hydrolase [Peniophora sp. CONT]|nr:alpha/beta-hydrolase [Peniophora sp. CONT]